MCKGDHVRLGLLAMDMGPACMLLSALEPSLRITMALGLSVVPDAEDPLAVNILFVHPPSTVRKHLRVDVRGSEVAREVPALRRDVFFYPSLEAASKFLQKHDISLRADEYMAHALTYSPDATLLTLKIAAALEVIVEIAVRSRYGSIYLLHAATGLPLSVVRAYVDPAPAFGRADMKDGLHKNALMSRDPAWRGLALGLLGTPAASKRFFRGGEEGYNIIKELGSAHEAFLAGPLILSCGHRESLCVALAYSRGPMLKAVVDAIIEAGRKEILADTNALCLITLDADPVEPNQGRQAAVKYLASQMNKGDLRDALFLSCDSSKLQREFRRYRPDATNKHRNSETFNALLEIAEGHRIFGLGFLVGTGSPWSLENPSADLLFLLEDHPLLEIREPLASRRRIIESLYEEVFGRTIRPAILKDLSPEDPKHVELLLLETRHDRDMAKIASWF